MCVSCNEGVVTFTGGASYVRFVNAQTKISGAIRIVIDSVTVFDQLEAGRVSRSFAVPAGKYVQLEVYSADSAHVRLASQRYMMAENQAYTVVVRGMVITDFLRPIVDTLASPLPNTAALKIINATEDEIVMLHIRDTSLIAPPQSITHFATIEPGDVTMRLTTLDSTSIGEPKNLELSSEKCYYIFVYDTLKGAHIEHRWFVWQVQQ